MTRKALWMLLAVLFALPVSANIPPQPMDIPEPEDVRFTTEDGWTIHATFYPSAHADQQTKPLVILIHQLNKTRAEYQTSGIRPALSRLGFHLLAIDARGHGLSNRWGEKTVNWRDDDFPWAEMPLDIKAALHWAREVRKLEYGPVAIMGSSIGSTNALKYAATDPAVKALVLLSPGIAYKGQDIQDAAKTYGERPALILATRGDRYSARSVEKLTSIMANETANIYEQARKHGVYIHQEEEGFVKSIADWLDKTLRPDHRAH